MDSDPHQSTGTKVPVSAPVHAPANNSSSSSSFPSFSFPTSANALASSTLSSSFATSSENNHQPERKAAPQGSTSAAPAPLFTGFGFGSGLSKEKTTTESNSTSWATSAFPAFGAKTANTSDSKSDSSLSSSWINSPAASTTTTSKDAPAIKFTFPAAPASLLGTQAAPSSTGFAGFGMPSSSLGGFGASASTSTGFGSSFGTSFGGVTGFGASTSTSGSNVNGASKEEEDDGEDSLPMLPPEVVLRNEADKDEILHEVECKLFRLDKEKNEWTEGGKGTFRLTRDPDTKKRRILIRNSIGKVTLNVGFYKGMKFEKFGKNGIRFLAVTGSDGEVKTILIRVKVEDLERTLQNLLESVDS